MAPSKLIVVVVAAKDLLPKNGQLGSPNAYCALDYGEQRKRTGVKLFDLNPKWDEMFEFVINDIEMPRDLEINIYQRNGTRSSFCGGVVIPISAVPERPGDVIRWYPLQKLPCTSSQYVKGDLGLRIWLQMAEPSSQAKQPDSLRPSLITETSTESLPTNFQHQLIMEENETDVNRGYKSNGSMMGSKSLSTLPSPSPSPRDLERIVESEGSSSANYQPYLVLSDPSYNPHDLDEPINNTKMLESIESEIENLLNERMVARAAHLETVKDLENANQSRVLEAFEYSSHTEWSIQETSPLCGSQLVAQSLQRTQSMLASKQTLEKFHIPLNLSPRIDDAMSNERQLVISVTNTARDAGEQQKQLHDIEQNAYRAYLGLIEKQNEERMELFKMFQQEKDQRLHLWAGSRRDTLDTVQSIKSNSQPLVEQLSSLVERTRKHERKLEAEVLRLLGGEAIKKSSMSCKSECQICFDCIEGPSSGTSKTHDLKQRSCLIPCNHAMICLPCATEIWESTKSCPFCKVMLITKPRALHLG